MRRTSPTLDALNPPSVTDDPTHVDQGERAEAAELVEVVTELAGLTHGLRRSYQAGCVCTVCCAANTAYTAAYRSAMRAGRPVLGTHVAGAEAHQTIAALVADGFSRAKIAAALGHAGRRLQYRGGVTLRTLFRLRRLQRHWTA